jgi:two-component system, cell cycle sensor histidine kinase and response regulator CckA
MHQKPGEGVAQNFQKDQEQLVTERASVILLLGWTLVPFFGWVDYILYPELFVRFMIYRLIAAAICAILHFMNHRLKLGPKSFYLGIAAAYVVALSIIGMILGTGGYSTPYYAGLNLVFLGMCTVLTIKVSLLALHSLAIYLIYLLAVLLFSKVDNVGLFLANNMFVASTLGIALVASHVGHRLRFREYLIRHELENTQNQLKRYSADLETLVAKSEKKYQALIDNADESIFIIQDDIIKFPNPRTIELFAYPMEELAHLPFIDLVLDEDRGIILGQRQQIAGAKRIIPTSTFRIMRRTGETVWVDMNAVSIEWGNRPGFLVFLRDVTEKKRMEAELIQAQKMEAIGTLAGGIAHDFNNLLMGILGYTSLMLLDTEPDNASHERLKSIEHLVESGADLTKQLLGFARGGKYEVKPIDVNELVRRSSDIFGRTKKEITIHRNCQKSLYAADVDRGQIEQVLLNLFVNAWQAMPGGGDLYLETSNVTLDEIYTRLHSIRPGNYVKISVTDNGTGMDQTTQRRIFEPFFTTKGMGLGTGLGLASAYGIIKNHGGIINVYSEVGRGTTFTIYLPASTREVFEEKIIPAEVKKSTETVLIVDDQDMILAVARDMLKTLGYQVFTAQGGKEALAIYKENKENIDVVILDMIMPSMGGGETFDKLKAINADARVILSSGYSINGQATEIMHRGCNGFIQKPFNIKELSQKIREVLDTTA